MKSFDYKLLITNQLLIWQASYKKEIFCSSFQCLECEGLFCPQKFVCHSHNPKNRTCHWGFDSDNWRSYLHLAEDYTDSEREKLSKIVADFKNRYKPTSTSTAITSKRKTVRHKNQLKSFKSYNLSYHLAATVRYYTRIYG